METSTAAFLNIKRSLTIFDKQLLETPHWAFAENNYGREAAAFLLDKWKQLRPRSGRLLEFKQH
jgi:hypothetical protein